MTDEVWKINNDTELKAGDKTGRIIFSGPFAITLKIII